MNDIKLTIEQKNIINDIIKNNLNPQKKIEEILTNKKKLLGEILAGNNQIDILLDKKNILDEFFEKYNSLKKAKESEYNKLLSEIKDIAGKIEIIEKQFYIKKYDISESKLNQIKKNITDIKLLKDNRKLYSEKFLAIKLKTIENIKKVILEKAVIEKSNKKLEEEVETAKMVGIKFNEAEKKQIINILKNKYKDEISEKDLSENKTFKKIKQIEKKIKSISQKSNQIEIDYTKIIDKNKEEVGTGKIEANKMNEDTGENLLTENHIDKIIGDGLYKRLENLGKIAQGNIEEIKKVYSIAKNGFNNNNLKEETDFIAEFLTKDRKREAKYVFMYKDTGDKIKNSQEEGNDKIVREYSKISLKPEAKIYNILTLLESLNIQKNFREIIDIDNISKLNNEIKKYYSIINTIRGSAINTSNDEFLEIINDEITNISNIYQNIGNILISQTNDTSNKLHKILKKIGEYIGIWYIMGIYTDKTDEFIESPEYELEQLVFNQLIQYESSGISDMNLDFVSDIWIYIDYIKSLVIEDLEKNNEYFPDINFLKNIYNSIDTIIGIYVNQLTINSKKKVILEKDKVNIRNNKEEAINKYKELGNKYYNSLPKIETISEDIINIGDNNNKKNQEQLVPMIITRNNDHKLLIGIGSKKEVEILYSKRRRSIREENKDMSEKEVIDLVKEYFYRETDIIDHKFIIPMTQSGVTCLYLHNDGSISVDGMSPYSLIDLLGDLNYEKVRSWILYYIYNANKKETKNNIGSPNEEISINYKAEKTTHTPKEKKVPMIIHTIKKLEETKEIPEEVLELSGYISDYLKDQKLSNGIQRIAYKSFQQRLFDFERYEKEYKIDKNDENRIEIKKRANDNGREGSYIEPKTGKNEIEEEERTDEEATDVNESDNITDIQSMPENIEGRIKFLEANNMYIYNSNKEKIEEFLIKGTINGIRYIGVTPRSLYKSIISKNKIIKKNKHNKNRRNIRIQTKGRRIMTKIDKKFLVVDIASYNDTYKKVRYNKYKENPNYSKKDIYIPE